MRLQQEPSITSAKSSVSEVKLTYCAQGSFPQTIPMMFNGKVHEATTPSQLDGSKVIFRVSATDNDGNVKETDEQSYVVGSGFRFKIPVLPWDAIITTASITMTCMILSSRKR